MNRSPENGSLQVRIMESDQIWNFKYQCKNTCVSVNTGVGPFSLNHVFPDFKRDDADDVSDDAGDENDDADD